MHIPTKNASDGIGGQHRLQKTAKKLQQGTDKPPAGPGTLEGPQSAGCPGGLQDPLGTPTEPFGPNMGLLAAPNEQKKSSTP